MAWLIDKNTKVNKHKNDVVKSSLVSYKALNEDDQCPFMESERYKEVYMADITWKTEEPLNTNSCVMSDYLDNINMLDIVLVDGTYAEGINCEGERFEIHASGDGDFCHHKIEFKKVVDKEGS